MGPQGPAARAVEHLQRPAPQGRAHPGVPAVQLDRIRHLVLHRRREDQAAVDLLRAPAAGVRARRNAAGRRPPPAAARHLQPGADEKVLEKTVRFRTVGDVTCTGCVESEAATVAEVVAETAVSRLTERGAPRADDRISEAGMEDRKRQGYF